MDEDTNIYLYPNNYASHAEPPPSLLLKAIEFRPAPKASTNDRQHVLLLVAEGECGHLVSVAGG